MNTDKQTTEQNTQDIQNIQIVGRDKSKDMSNTIVLPLFAVGVIVVMVGSYIAFGNYFGTISSFLAGVMVVIFYLQPPKTIKITLNELGIVVDESPFLWKNILEWGALEIDNCYEIMMLTNKITSQYVTFYIPKIHFQQYSLFTSVMYSKVKYSNDLNKSNSVQNLLRLMGLK